MQKQATLLLMAMAGVAILSAVLESVDGQGVCVHCVCPPSYSPVCGYRSKTNSLRGFPSRCMLECSNKCRKHKYEFVFNGRCGKYSPSTTSEATSGSSTMAYAAPEATTLPPSTDDQHVTLVEEPPSSR